MTLLLKLDGAKAAGLGQISNKILTCAGPVIYRNWIDLFNVSLKLRILRLLETDKVLLVFKAGERNDPNN